MLYISVLLVKIVFYLKWPMLRLKLTTQNVKEVINTWATKG